jgi:hypothetical protein
MIPVFLFGMPARQAIKHSIADRTFSALERSPGWRPCSCSFRSGRQNLQHDFYSFMFVFELVFGFHCMPFPSPAILPIFFRV